MNSFNELKEILKKMGGSSTFDELCYEYEQRTSILLSINHKISIYKTLCENAHDVFYDDKTNKWQLRNGQIIKKSISNLPLESTVNEINNVLKSAINFDPLDYDGSYELIKNVIEEYKNEKSNINIDVNDMNYIYSCCIGTWKMSVDVKKDRLKKTNLPETSKNKLISIMDQIWDNACSGHYYNSLNNVDSTKPQFGMLGTGFMVFGERFTDNDANKFINLCIEIIDENNEENIYKICEKTLNEEYQPIGFKTGSASAILHCLKPTVFPIMNSNDSHGTIYESLGIEQYKQKELYTYIQNSRKIKEHRDKSYPFKNYRLYDVAAWALDNENFNLYEYIEGYKLFVNNKELRHKANIYGGGVASLLKLLDRKKIKYRLTSKEPSARIAIDTELGTIGIYDRKKEKKVRIDIPKEHELAKKYEEIGGYLFNETNSGYQTGNYISVYFDENTFEKLAPLLK